MPAESSSPSGSSSPSAVLAVLGRGLVEATEPVARADDAGLTRGDGCFEGCRLHTDASGVSSIDKIERHLARMSRSAANLEIPFDEPAWRSLIDTAAAAWTVPGEASVKLLLTRGPAGSGEPTGLVWISATPPETARLRANGLKIITLSRGFESDAFAAAPWLLGGVKTLSYAVNMAAQREAARRGCDDVLFVGTDGIVLEAPTSSAVWATGRELHTTPRGATGILAGTTQQLLFDQAPAAGWTVHETLATVDDLHAADVLWLTSSGRGPIDVVELDGKARTRVPAVDAEIRRLSGF